MRTTFLALLTLVALTAMLTPTEAGAYGAAHVGYTHVGPNGVYHTGATAVSGPGGVYAGGHTTAAGYGGASASTYRGGYATPAGGAAYSAGRVYAPSYGRAGYAYVR